MTNPFNLSKQGLIDKGWTEENLLGRLQSCRQGLIEARQNSIKFNRPDTFWTYRYLFICQYLALKRDLKVLRS